MRWLLACAAVLLAGLAMASPLDLLGRIERAILYPFDSTRVSPSDIGLPQITETIWSRDEADLVLWHTPPKPGRPVVIYFHGNAGNLASRARRFEIFLRNGFGLIALSPRSAGGSSGTPTQEALTADAAALLSEAREFEPAAAQSNIVIYGESIGTAIAIAALDASDAQIAGVVLEAPFTSIPDIAAANDQIPASLIPRIQDRWDSLSRAETLTAPLLVIHGPRDTVVPFSQGKQIFAAAPARSKRFREVPGAGHSDLWRSDVIAEITDFIRSK